MPRRAQVLLLALATLGCSNIIPSTREDAYEHRVFVGNQAISFRWFSEAMPLKIYVDPASPLYPHFQTAIGRWQQALLYGEFRGILVSDSAGADIIVNNQLPDAEAQVSLRAMAPQCNGETQLDIDTERLELHLPIRVFVWANGTPSAEALTTCYRLTSTHELGHALGIMEHSPDATDVMYYNPVLDGLSEADRQTIQIVFHSLPTLTIVHDNDQQEQALLEAARPHAVRSPF